VGNCTGRHLGGVFPNVGEDLWESGSSICNQRQDKYRHVDISEHDDYLCLLISVTKSRIDGSYLAFANPGNFLGHLGHMYWPFGRCIGATAWTLGPACGVRGNDGARDGSCPGIDPFTDSRAVVLLEEGEIEVWFALSSSSEGLEGVETDELAERERSRTTPPTTETHWLASETDSVRSR